MKDLQMQSFVLWKDYEERLDEIQGAKAQTQAGNLTQW
jgi:hypothetical protein